MRIKKLITILLLSGLTAINMCSCDKNSKEITTSEVMEDNIEVVNENDIYVNGQANIFNRKSICCVK